MDKIDLYYYLLLLLELDFKVEDLKAEKLTFLENTID